MFLGRYYHNLDDKDRLTIPARYREALADGAYILQGFDRNLMVLTPPAFEAMAQRVNQTSLTDDTSRLLRRLVFSTADRLDLDKAGRILIPEFLRQHAALQNETILVGAGDYFEIWSPMQWAEQFERLLDSGANAQRFAALDLSTSPPSGPSEP